MTTFATTLRRILLAGTVLSLSVGFATASAADFTVHIKNYKYHPAALTVHTGDKVTWTNDDSIGHTVTADNGSSFDSGDIAPGKSWSHVFTSKGSDGYHCSYHPWMKGTVTVK